MYIEFTFFLVNIIIGDKDNFFVCTYICGNLNPCRDTCSNIKIYVKPQ